MIYENGVGEEVVLLGMIFHSCRTQSNKAPHCLGYLACFIVDTIDIISSVSSNSDRIIGNSMGSKFASSSYKTVSHSYRLSQIYNLIVYFIQGLCC